MPLPRAHTKSTALTLEDAHQVSQWDFGVFWVCCSLHFFLLTRKMYHLKTKSMLL